MNRIGKLQLQLKEHALRQCLIVDILSIEYLIGKQFHPGERFLGLLVFVDRSPLLVLNQLFPCISSDLFEIVEYQDGDDVIALLNAHLLPDTLAVDNSLPAMFLLPLIASNEKRKIELGSYLVDELRLIKEEQEQEKMRRSSELNDQIMSEVAEFLQIGVLDTEVEEFILEKHKAYEVVASFAPIVAFKKTASDPHASANGQRLEGCDVVVIDMGLVLESYCSDMTRTFVFQYPLMEEVYEVVKQANLAAIAMIVPGVRFCDIDAAARNVIEKAGYGPYFTHRTGHGIGLAVHEPMDVSRVNTAVVKTGMCFSIEPGIYLPGIGGVRIEDLVLVTLDGVEVLNSYPK